MNLLLLILLHLAAILGALLLLRIKAPAAALIGSMFGVVIFFVVTPFEVAYPPQLHFFAQVLSGLIIGMRFSRRDLHTLRAMAKPAILLFALVVITNVSFALLMFRVADFNFMTALFSTGLGGVSDIALIATDFGADMEPVALLQLFCMVTVVIAFPPLIKGMLSPHRGGIERQRTSAMMRGRNGSATSHPSFSPHWRRPSSAVSSSRN
ncbi:MAG TPA: AbrB family transcriptional regulator [Sphaerochaeta sp.]|jgi:membrane AbrB-like protein|nr:AbrB family transcriptional regulator [Sphaerochaeta sp.]HPZ16527.1 AbrB family transcriptional regulator [Sphaerochaeta sp.]